MLKRKYVLTLVLFMASLSYLYSASSTFTKTDRGVKIDADRYQATFKNGILVSLLNKLTQEEYCKRHADVNKILPHLPSGLGTQGHKNKEMIDRAYDLFAWPWWEHPEYATWPNQHYADDKSSFTFKDNGSNGCTITYKNLTDGKTRHENEIFSVDLAVDPKTGDLLITPEAISDQVGVYGANFTCTALAAGISIEAPVVDGLRIKPDMVHSLWNNQWPGWWQFGFIALNGSDKGSIAVWCQDQELKMYKNFFYLVNDQGLSFSLAALNIPPFEQLKSAKPLTWRIQAYENPWSEGVANYRNWRDKNVKMAKHPDWTKQISVVQKVTSPTPIYSKRLTELWGEKSKRVLTWAYAVRKAGFDKNHADNSPYDEFVDHIKEFKNAGHRVIVYLQPMLMWTGIGKSLSAKDAAESELAERNKEGAIAQPLARTIFPFRDPLPKTKEESVKANRGGMLDQSHLGHKRFRNWFFGWVDDYIDKYGTDGIYYDQAYHCAIDSRGLIDGTTSPQGMADWFYLSQTNHPNAAFASELANEANLTGLSFAIASPPNWGTRKCINLYKMKNASPITSALCYPYAVMFDFTMKHSYENLMDLHERRAQIPCGIGQDASEHTRGVSWFNTQKAKAFIEYGLRPVFPIKWDPKVLSYYRGQHGEDYRYVKTSWGTGMVKVEDGKEKLIMARARGVRYIPDPPGAINEWPLYVKESPYGKAGPIALNPIEHYVVNPNREKPDFYAELSRDGDLLMINYYIEDGFSAEGIVGMEFKEDKQLRDYKIMPLYLRFNKKPAVFFKNGTRQNIDRWGNVGGEGTYQACALENKPEPGLDHISSNLVVRGIRYSSKYLTSLVREEQAERLKKPNTKKNELVIRNPINQIKNVHVPITVPDDMPEGSFLKIEFPQKRNITFDDTDIKINFAPPKRQWVSIQTAKNGNEDVGGQIICRKPVKAGETLLVSVTGLRGSTKVSFDWEKPVK